MTILIIKRILAFLVDFIITTAILFGFTLLLISIVLLVPDLLIPGLGAALFINNYQESGLLPLLSLKSIYILNTIYNVFFSYIFRATPGKFIFRLKLATIEGKNDISLIKLIIRELAKAFLGFFSVLSLFFTQGERALHDYFTDTKVVESSKAKPFIRPSLKKIISMTILTILLILSVIIWDLITYISKLN